MKHHPTVLRFPFAALVIATVAACSSAPGTTDDAVATSVGAVAAATTFTFFTVSTPDPRSPSRHTPAAPYQAAPVDGSSIACGNGWPSSSCGLGALDFSQMDISASDIATIESRLVSTPWEPVELFVGNITTSNGLPTLHVYEVWRADVAAPLFGGTMYQVSHTPTQVLSVGDWRRQHATALDVTAVPSATRCEGFEIPQKCYASTTLDMDNAATQAGVIAYGTISHNTVEATQIFTKIGVGQGYEADGFFLCVAGQVGCQGRCIDAGTTCIQRYGNGRGLIFSGRADGATFDSWLQSTGQLAPGETGVPPAN